MIDDPVQFGGAPHRLKAWLIFVLEEATRLGLAPLSQEKLHLLFFYAAVLAPVHGLDKPVPKIIKQRDKPFYPEAQDMLVRLVVNGFVEADTRQSINDLGWDANGYAISAAGIRVSGALKASKWGQRTAGFARSLVTSFAELDPDDATEIIKQDATYRDDRMRLWEIKDLRKENLAAATAHYIADYEVDGLRPNAKETISLYFDYLMARRAA